MAQPLTPAESSQPPTTTLIYATDSSAWLKMQGGASRIPKGEAIGFPQAIATPRGLFHQGKIVAVILEDDSNRNFGGCSLTCLPQPTHHSFSSDYSSPHCPPSARAQSEWP